MKNIIRLLMKGKEMERKINLKKFASVLLTLMVAIRIINQKKLKKERAWKLPK